MEAIKEGDTVRLKSGGPLMTVERLTTSTPFAGEPVRNLARCVWTNDDGHMDGELFSVVTLKLES